MNVAYDLTHVVTRLTARYPTGIDQVDLAYARHFCRPAQARCVGVHYGLLRPHVFDAAAARRIVAKGEAGWPHVEHPLSPSWPDDAAMQDGKAPRAVRSPSHSLKAWATSLAYRLRHTPGATIPNGARYLNIAQHALEYPLLLSWLARRPDLVKVFFIHDLLPLDVP